MINSPFSDHEGFWIWPHWTEAAASLRRVRQSGGGPVAQTVSLEFLWVLESEGEAESSKIIPSTSSSCNPEPPSIARCPFSSLSLLWGKRGWGKGEKDVGWENHSQNFLLGKTPWGTILDTQGTSRFCVFTEDPEMGPSGSCAVLSWRWYPGFPWKFLEFSFFPSVVHWNDVIKLTHYPRFSPFKQTHTSTHCHWAFCNPWVTPGTQVRSPAELTPQNTGRFPGHIPSRWSEVQVAPGTRTVFKEAGLLMAVLIYTNHVTQKLSQNRRTVLAFFLDKDNTVARSI